MNTYWFPAVAPGRVAVDFGVVQIHWYGIIMVAAILAAFAVVKALAKRSEKVSEHELADMFFYLVLYGVVGARLWHVFVFHWDYYAERLWEIPQIWQGGIAIQGALLGGLLYLWWHVHSRHHRLAAYTDLIVPGIALGQAIGRWGNFFNQELYGRPTSLPWGIYIDPQNRVPGLESYSYFHPTFLYESLLNLMLFGVLLWLFRKTKWPGLVTAMYMIGYGVIRFVVEAWRVDPLLTIGWLRMPQIVSLGFILAGGAVAYWSGRRSIANS